jgi:cytochrome c-type biogenesis protein CcmH
MLWTGLVGLLLIALLFFVPLLRSGKRQASAEADRTALNVALYRDYEDELASDSRLSSAERATLLAEKAAALLEDSAGITVVPELETAAVRGGWMLRFAALPLLVAGSLATYEYLGTPMAEQLVHARDILRLPPAGAGHGTELRELTAGLKAHLEGTPADAGSWYLLGIGEMKAGAYSAASAAFERAHRLVGEDSNLDLYWLQARFLADAGELTPESQAIAQRLLTSQPNQPLVLELLALAAFRGEDYAGAISYLNRALSGDLSAAQRDALTGGFVQARDSLGVRGPTVDVKVELESAPPASATLFVIARPVGGGMPFAVVRRPASAIPERVRLDDAVSMNPAAPLSAAKEFEVLVRLSLSGQARAAPGDWQWQSGKVQLDQVSEPLVLEAKLVPPTNT